MEIALYVRVSTNRQQQSQTIEQQLDRLRAAVAHHADWHLADGHIFRDDGYSGAKFNRPGLDRLRDQASMAAFELVLMTAPDRLARNYVHQVLLIDDLQKVGCRVEFLERPMSEDPHDQLLLHIRGAVAEYERNLIAERMRRGRQAKLQSGLLLPWTVAPYGYVLDPERPRDASRVRLDPVKAEIVRQMFAWYTDPAIPATLYWVAKQLSEQQIPTPTGNSRWNVATIRGILRSPAYAGAAISGRTRPTPARQRKSALQPVGPGQSQRPAPVEEWITIPVPAIVSQETFDLAQKRLDENKQMARRNNRAHDYLLRGLVSCAGCQLAAALFAQLAVSLSRYLLHRRLPNKLLVNVIARGIGVGVFLIGLYIVFQIAGLTRIALTVIGGTGLLGLVLGIAFRDITENFLSSIFLSMQNPFHTGDLVEIDDTMGFVQLLTTRATVIMTLEGNHVQIPNATVYKSKIFNYTSNPNRRVGFTVGIGYEDKITTAQELVMGVLAEHPAVLKEPEPLVLVDNLGSATVNLQIYFWVDGSQHGWQKVRSSAIRLVKRTFQNAHISMPDEARELIFPHGVTVRLVEPGDTDIMAEDKAQLEPETISTEAEGGLRSEAGEIERQARHSRTPEEGENLLDAAA
jgi:small-conductance mechanosensitive channel/DNA invertase Pin-like site-specific DNA recombinase